MEIIGSFAIAQSLADQRIVDLDLNSRNFSDFMNRWFFKNKNEERRAGESKLFLRGTCENR